MAVRPATRQSGLTGRAANCVLSGELDLSTHNQTRRTCRLAMRAGPDLVIDVADVTFIDCAGLAPLLEVVRDVGTADGRVTLLGAGRAMRRLLSLTGLWDQFDVRPASWPRAVASQPGRCGDGVRGARSVHG